MKNLIVLVFVFLTATVLMAVAQMSTPWNNPYFYYHYNAPLPPLKTPTDEMDGYNKHHLSGYGDQIVSDSLGAHSLLISTCVRELRTTKADLAQTTQRLNATYTEMESIKDELNNVMDTVENLKKTVNERTSPIVDIGKMPSSCEDLQRMGNRRNGFFSVMGQNKIQTVHCNFAKPQNDQNFQSLIGYVDVKSSPVYFFAQKSTTFTTIDGVIPFEIFRLNVGNAINSTGVFVAPRPGTYSFSFSAISNVNTLARVDMQMKNATADWFKIGQAYGQPIIETLTMQSTLQLIKGDQIRLILKEGGIHDRTDVAAGLWTHFVGLLIEEDIF